MRNHPQRRLLAGRSHVVAVPGRVVEAIGGQSVLGGELHRLGDGNIVRVHLNAGGATQHVALSARQVKLNDGGAFGGRPGKAHDLPWPGTQARDHRIGLRTGAIRQARSSHPWAPLHRLPSGCSGAVRMRTRTSSPAPNTGLSSSPPPLWNWCALKAVQRVERGPGAAWCCGPLRC